MNRGTRPPRRSPPRARGRVGTWFRRALWAAPAIVLLAPTCFDSARASLAVQPLASLPQDNAPSNAESRAPEAILVLRTRDIVRGQLTQLTDDGVLLGETWISWGDIEQGLVPRRQAEFTERLQRLGEPLFRLQIRLRHGDDRRLAAPLQALESVYQMRRSRTAYVVWQARMWNRLADGRSADAAVAYLHCWDLLQENPAWRDALPGGRVLRHQATLGLADDIAPVFFDAEQATLALRELERWEPAAPPPGFHLYRAALAIAAGRAAAADGALRAMGPHGDGRMEHWRHLLQARRMLDEGRPALAEELLATVSQESSGAVRGWSWYWLGCAAFDAAKTEQQRRDAQLWWARAAAIYGEHDALAAAALLRLCEQQPDALRPPLLQDIQLRYGHTHFGKLALRMYGDAKP